MIRAYDRMYLHIAQCSMGDMLDFAVHDLNLTLDGFYNKFINSDVSVQFARGNCSYIAGRSGIELALDVLGIDDGSAYYRPVLDRSEEYWTGWALAYFQWTTGLLFKSINDYISILEIRRMYHPYHEMDITNFVQKMTELYRSRKQESNLKIYRIKQGISQRELAEGTGVPLRTIQQYEQRQKDINAAKTETLINISRYLFCNVDDLMEL